MQIRYYLAASAAALSIATAVSTPALAQQITSGIEGTVVKLEPPGGVADFEGDLVHEPPFYRLPSRGRDAVIVNVDAARGDAGSLCKAQRRTP